MKKRIPAAGYTLVEVMITVTIVGVVAAIGSMAIVQLQNFYLGVTARNDTQRDARASIEIIDRLMRQAKASSICITSPNQTPACGAIPTTGVTGGYYSGVAFTTIDGRNVAFYQNGNQLIMVVNNDKTLLSKNLGYLSFAFPNTNSAGIISVALTMQKSTQLGLRKALEMSIQNVRIMN